jgi:oligopeptide/dipeptide ABC transporter ATP-binding protein
MTTAEPSSADPAARRRPLLEVRDLIKTFGGRGRGSTGVQAVAGVSFELFPGETLGLVGETGCGKSTALRCALHLIEPTSGTVRFDGVDLGSLGAKELRRARRRFQMVFQDPQASLNPRMTVREIIGEPLVVQGAGPAEVAARVHELTDLVQLHQAYLERRPHEFSGGQRQRIGIARALALEPDLVALDEPLSALDVSIQAEIVRLLGTLKDELDLAYLFVAHDLAVVRHLCDRVAVMYLGRIVEIGDNDDIYERPAHPYTQALLAATPYPDPRVQRRRERIVMMGELPSPAAPPPGCRFHTRCWKATELCAREQPPLADPGIGHAVACHYPEVVDVISRSTASRGQAS